jgi:hypothetical protein
MMTTMILSAQSSLPIGYNQRVWGSANGIQTYTFDGEAGTTISIELVSFGGSATTGSLIVPNGDTMPLSVDINFDVESILEFFAANLTTYYASLENYTLPDTGTYTISLNGRGIHAVALTTDMSVLPSELNQYWLAYAYTNNPLAPNAGIAFSRADGTDKRMLTRPINADLVAVYDTCPSFTQGQILYSRIAYRIPLLDFDNNSFTNPRGSLGYDEISYSFLNLTAPDGTVEPSVPVLYGEGLNGRYFETTVVYQSEDGDIFVDDVNLTNSPNTQDSHPTWSSDGTQILWTSGDDIWVMNSDGSDKQLFIANATQATVYQDQIAYVSNGQLFLTDGTETLQLTNDAEATNLAPAWSPDGEFLAFQSDLANIGIRFSIHILRVSNPSERYAINVDGGESRCPSFAPFTTIPPNSISGYQPVVRGGDLAFGDVIEDAISAQNQDYWLFQAQAGDVISGTITAEQMPLVEVFFYSDSTAWTMDDLLSLDQLTISLSSTRIGGNAVAPLAPREPNFATILPYSGYYMVRVMNGARYEQPYTLQVQMGLGDVTFDPLAPVVGEVAYAFDTPLNWLDYDFFIPQSMSVDLELDEEIRLVDDEIEVILRTPQAVATTFLDYRADNANPLDMLRSARVTWVGVRDIVSDNTQILIGDTPIYGFSYIKQDSYGVFVAVPSVQGLVLIHAISANQDLNTLWGYAVGVAETIARSASVDVFVPPTLDPETLPEDIQAIRDEWGYVSTGLLPRVVPSEGASEANLNVPTGQQEEWSDANITFVVPDSYFPEFDDYYRSWRLENPTNSHIIFVNLSESSTPEAALEEAVSSWEIALDNIQMTPEGAIYFITTSASEGNQTIFMTASYNGRIFILQGRVPKNNDTQPLIDDMRGILQSFADRELSVGNPTEVPLTTDFTIANGESWRATNEVYRLWAFNVYAGQRATIRVESFDIDPDVTLSDSGVQLVRDTSEDNARETIIIEHTFTESTIGSVGITDFGLEDGEYIISLTIEDTQPQSSRTEIFVGLSFTVPDRWARLDYEGGMGLFNLYDEADTTAPRNRVSIFLQLPSSLEEVNPNVDVNGDLRTFIETRYAFALTNGYELGEIESVRFGDFDGFRYTFARDEIAGYNYCFIHNAQVHCIQVVSRQYYARILQIEAENILNMLTTE